MILARRPKMRRKVALVLRRMANCIDPPPSATWDVSQTITPNMSSSLANVRFAPVKGWMPPKL